MKTTILFFLACLASFSSFAQHDHSHHFSHQDSLRGTITPEREWWDLLSYDLSITVNISERSLAGKNVIKYKALKQGRIMQIDLQAPMQIEKVVQDGKKLKVKSDGNAHFIYLESSQQKDDIKSLTVHYSGQPTESTRPPWSGGLTWKKDRNGKDFIVTTCQGDGASMWWPCKDHMYDENEEGMTMRFTVPEHLVAVGNGRLIETKAAENGQKTYVWRTVNPINNYGVNLNIGDYVHFGEVYNGEKGALDCDYYVLRNNLKKAKQHFQQVPKMLAAFEHWFGAYPFYEDSYKLVEVPYPGMEHQSSVTYGNGYKNGYGLRDVSGTGWGMNFDFIIIHESGHEWFANNVTYKDIADMWIHEGFTAYSENLFLDYHYGTDASAEYVIGTRQNIQNDKPIIGHYNVNNSGSSDMYYKGANMLHTIRTLVNNNAKWRKLLRGLNSEYYHQTVTTKQIEDYMIKETGIDLQPVFDQYLRTTTIPVLEILTDDTTLSYQWTNCIKDFTMPVNIIVNGKLVALSATTSAQTIQIPSKASIKGDINFYVVYQIN